jgi:hypothetical protein
LFEVPLRLLILPSRPEGQLEAENAALKQQLAILQRKQRGRVQLANGDRFFLVQLYRWFPSILKTMTVVQPATLLRWHRAGFRRYWRWKSRNCGGRPPISAELRALIRRMSLENQLWGAPHIHGELLKLGFTVAQSTVAKYMLKPGDGRSGQSWGTFLRNHLPHIAAMDLFVVPTITFVQLYVLVIVRLARRELVWVNVTAHPTAAADQRGLSLGQGPTLPDPGSRCRLRCSCHPAPPRHGHSRQADLGRFTMAKLLCGTTDRHDPTGVRRPPDRAWRGTPTSSPC